MVLPVEKDARGIVAPEAGLAHFRLDRYPPSPGVDRFVDRYWVVSWDLRGRPAHTQRVLPHPVVNVVFMDGEAIAHGVKSRIDSRTLAGAGRVLGVMFRPAGFRPFLDGPASAMADREIPLPGIFGPAAAALTGRVHAAASGEDMASAADQFLASVIPSAP